MLAMLVAYDAAGNVIATLDHLVARDENGDVVGLVDFEAHELAGGQLADVWQVEGALGSGTWPEWLGARAHEFRVERQGGRITALIHRTSGARRERVAIDAAIAARRAQTPDGPVDLRDILGGPSRPLELAADGRTKERTPETRPSLPVVAARVR